ncbi:ABC-type polysaccharide/polyol phosphate transport system ATPase subunit [Bradyrhizobium diazoefficiens]|nr:ABC transporter ATP-binding protein [Bradyrhizobium diazoefficiens]
MKVVPSRSSEWVGAVTPQKPASAIIEIDRVSQVFQTSSRKDHLALSEISLTIAEGAFVSILGP